MVYEQVTMCWFRLSHFFTESSVINKWTLMRCQTGNISFQSVLVANVIFAWPYFEVVDIAKYGLDLESTSEFINSHVL